MDVSASLKDLGLTTENCVVIGSGILSALGIRDSSDIDVVTDEETYNRLASSARFTKTENHGREILSDELLEIGTSWGVLGKDQSVNDLFENSIVIGDIRYITLDFLFAVKKSWLKDDDVRQKDIDDVKLINNYLVERS